MAAFTWLLALAVRGTAVLLAALCLQKLLRSATARHRLWTLAALALLLLPAAPALLPRWELRLVPGWMEPSRGPAVKRPDRAPEVVSPVSAEAAAVSGGVSLPAPRPSTRDEATSFGAPFGAAGGLWR